jgi:hypothetical protein
MKGSTWLGVIASLISIGAGIYLIGSESASAETTVFDALMHGIGAYFVARGCWMLYEMRAMVVGSEEKPSLVGQSFRIEGAQRGDVDAT